METLLSEPEQQAVRLLHLVNIKVVDDGVEAGVEVVEQRHHLRVRTSGEVQNLRGEVQNLRRQNLTSIGVLSADIAVNPTMSLK